MFYIIIFLHSLVFSKDIKIISELDTATAFIGDVINWSVKMQASDQYNYRFPKFSLDNDTIKISQTKSKNEMYDQINFEIISWDTGSFATPNYSVEVLDQNGELDFRMSAPRIDYIISSILPTLNEEAFRPLKGPVPVKDIWPIKNIILLILIIITIYCIILVWRRRKPKQYSKLDYTFAEDPKERALRRIQELSLSQFTKDFYTELSHISREYIEAKYFIRTLEMTTNEIKESRLLFPVENSWFNEWIIFLSLADQVKYALELPDKDRMKSDKDKIKSIIIEL